MSLRANQNEQTMRSNLSPSLISSVPEVKTDELENWVSDLYDISKITPADVKWFWEAFSYKGFSRDDVLRQLYVAIKDKRIVMELIVVGALAGPQRGSNIKLSNGKSSNEMGISASGKQGRKDLTLNKIVSATADLAAWFLKQMNAPKRINVNLPGWLQFPSAGSIILPPQYRTAHLEFSQRFSKLIGGEFNEQIYLQMESNAYLDPRLKLFS
jgi:hypothetical protein